MEMTEMVKLAATIKAEREKADCMKAELSVVNKGIEAYEQVFVTALKEAGLTSLATPSGTIYYSQKPVWTLPSNPEDKAAFFDYLKEKGIFEAYATVNYASMNSLCAKEKELADAEGRGMEFKIPGIGEPTLRETIGMRKGK